MSIMNWILLLLVAAGVGGVYWYMRGHNDSNPWNDMDAEAEDVAPELSPQEQQPAEVAAQDAMQEPEPAAKSNAEPVQESAPTATQPVADTPQAAAEPQDAAQPTSVMGYPKADIKISTPPPGEEKVFVLYVKKPQGEVFEGPDIHAGLQKLGLKYGPHDLYHRSTADVGHAESIYCVANMVKPGILDPVDQDHLTTPGLTFFLVLPGPEKGVAAMRDMMETAGKLAQYLGGKVFDENHSQLNEQTARYVLDDIAELDRRARLREVKS